MTPDNSGNTGNVDLMVHDMIGRLFEEPEPTHRTDLADGAIAHGMAVTRRRGFAVAGATLSVLAVVAGAVATAGRGVGPGGGDWSLDAGSTTKISPQTYEDDGPTYADRQREIIQQLPTLVGRLFGVPLSQDQRYAGSVTYMRTGDLIPGVMLNFAGGRASVRFDGVDRSGYEEAFAKASSAPVAVAGGSIRVAVLSSGGESGDSGFNAWYEFAPTDKSQQTVRFSIHGEGKTAPVSAAAFQKLVGTESFAQLQHVLDPSVQASESAVQLRKPVEAKINAEASTVLPPGFRLKFNPGAPGALELVSREGVNTFAWVAIDTGKQPQIACPAVSLCFAPYSGEALSKVVEPDGKTRLGVYAGWTGTAKDSSVVISVFGKSQPMTSAGLDPVQMGKPTETAPQGPGLTPQQAMAIVKAPGVAKVIADVTKLAALYD